MVTDHVSGSLSELDRSIVEHVPPGGNWRDLPTDFPSQRVQQIRASAGRGEGSRSTYYGRLRWEQPSYTISTYLTRPGNGCFIHPSEPRLITVREAARLQTFPDGWRFSGTLRHRAVQIGNAVPPLLAFAVARMFAPGNAVDLFSGTGGLSLGAHLAGHEVVAAVDNEPAAVESHNLNLPGGAAFVADLRDSESAKSVWQEIKRRAAGDIDLLMGGPPCQGFSTAGKGLRDDPRNRLLWSFAEGVRALRPRAVVMENVVALAQSRGRRHLAEVRGALEDMGYLTDVKILHAEGYGVPQRRRRMILIASRNRLPEWAEADFHISAPAFMQHQPGGPGGLDCHTVLDAIGDLRVPEGMSLDAPVTLRSSATALQRWLRGEAEEVDKAA
ncbi:MAG: DNA (cytosine-5-)-methyltransferase [Microbacterium sp.]